MRASVTTAGTVALVLAMSGCAGDAGRSVPPPLQRGPDDVAMDSVPAGELEMGSQASSRQPDAPTHRVFVDAFDIDRVEVTVDRFSRCVRAGACEAREFSTTTETPWCNYGAPGRGDHPMNCVSWQGLAQYCAFAGKRLPTEAEWERAARGGDGRRYPWGASAPTCKLAVIDEGGIGCGAAQPPYSRPVGSLPAGAGPYGTLDLLGNVREWCADWYAPDAYASGAARNPAGPPTGTTRAVRGGDWSSRPDQLDASARWWNSPSLDLLPLPIGGRCVRSLTTVR